MLRQELGDLADEYVPLVNGGITLSKLGGVMHDTCNCANAIARRVRVLRDNSEKDLYGEVEWQRKSEEEHAWCDYFCGNHSRNLQFDAFGRLLYEAYIKRQLGAGLEAARLKSGGRVRVEPSGEAMLRTICKLTHIVPKQYAKGQTPCFHWVYFFFFFLWLKTFPPLHFSHSLFLPLAVITLFSLLSLRRWYCFPRFPGGQFSRACEWVCRPGRIQQKVHSLLPVTCMLCCVLS